MEKNNAVVLVIVKLVFVTPVVTRRVYAEAEFQIYPSRVDTSPRVCWRVTVNN